MTHLVYISGNEGWVIRDIQHIEKHPLYFRLIKNNGTMMNVAESTVVYVGNSVKKAQTICDNIDEQFALLDSEYSKKMDELVSHFKTLYYKDF